MNMANSHRRVVAVSLALLTVLSVVIALPAIALEPDSGSTYASPSAPGATAEYRVTVNAQPGDSITQNGLKQLTLDFSADPDFSGSTAGVTARDVDVLLRAPNANGSVPAGPVEVSTNPAGDRLTVTLLSAYQNIQPGTQISVRVDGVRNTEIAIPDPQGLRGFALGVSASDPQGNTDGPVRVRYTIDPNATAPNATANGTATNVTNATANGTTANATATNVTNATANGTAANETAANATATNVTNATANGTAANATAAGATTTTSATPTETPTAEATTTGGGGQTTTETTGPGFGLLAAAIALLAAGLLATRRRD